ncbi:hypothetical protein LG634_11485 [Streptomyces bambusae]|uniref:hypothetical protein n=1 Tax=Streptomyces bambusae TaxID=1550616 RepID=UPI001CFEAC92|nr:hypothetical protein [Streptomyces bambusae]MCB5165451.1 hypothetical protein [Streptomyces bambusae]
MGIDWALAAAVFFLGFCAAVAAMTVFGVAVRLRRRSARRTGPLGAPAPTGAWPKEVGRWR